MDMITVGVPDIDLYDIEILDVETPVILTHRFESLDEFHSSACAERKMFEFERRLRTDSLIPGDTDDMNQSLIARIEPGTWKRKIGPRAGTQAKHRFIPFDQNTEPFGSQVNVVQLFDFHLRNVSPVPAGYQIRDNSLSLKDATAPSTATV